MYKTINTFEIYFFIYLCIWWLGDIEILHLKKGIFRYSRVCNDNRSAVFPHSTSPTPPFFTSITPSHLLYLPYTSTQPTHHTPRPPPSLVLSHFPIPHADISALTPTYNARFMTEQFGYKLCPAVLSGNICWPAAAAAAVLLFLLHR